MDTETVIEFLDELYWLRMKSVALPNMRKTKDLRSDEIAIMFKLELMALQRFETELTKELAPLVSMLRVLPIREQLTYVFDGPHYVAAIMLVQYLHQNQN